MADTVSARFVAGIPAPAPIEYLSQQHRKAVHLVLAYRPSWQSVDDLTAIARHVHDLDPEIGWPAFVLRQLQQFDALRTTALVLAERTRREAE